MVSFSKEWDTWGELKGSFNFDTDSRPCTVRHYRCETASSLAMKLQGIKGE